MLLVATSNRGKLEEFRELLSDLPFDVRAPGELLSVVPQVVEDGRTFAENATKKAKALAEATMTLTLADDSGLSVDLLDGAPGVRSARFAHERATDSENNAALLDALERAQDPSSGSSASSRARFCCALALVDPLDDGAVHLAMGTCEGTVTTTPKGMHGFGYDPLFLVDGAGGRTMAELTPGEKNAASHRGRAMAALRPRLVEIARATARRVHDVTG